MILWSGHYKIEDDLIELVKSQIKENPNSLDQKLKFHTTYYLGPDKPEVIFLEYYSKIIETVTKELSLHHRCLYNFPFWAQLYTKKSRKFDSHDHFSGSEVLSWVHFLSDSTKKCFHFLNSNGEKTYPEQQNKGDFIVFPSWMLHCVDPPETDERFVISGNVNLDIIETEIDTFKYSKCSYHHVEGKDVGMWFRSVETRKTSGKKGFRTSI